MNCAPRRTLVVFVAMSLLGILALGARFAAWYYDPPCPPGWSNYDDKDFRVALPPGQRIHDSPPVRIKVRSNVEVGVAEFDFFMSGEENIEAFFEMHRLGGGRVPHYTGKESIRFRRHPAVIANKEPAFPELGELRTKLLVVATKSSTFVLWAELSPGVFSEHDADLFFNSFRPK